MNASLWSRRGARKYCRAKAANDKNFKQTKAIKKTRQFLVGQPTKVKTILKTNKSRTCDHGATRMLHVRKPSDIKKKKKNKKQNKIIIYQCGRWWTKSARDNFENARECTIRWVFVFALLKLRIVMVPCCAIVYKNSLNKTKTKETKKNFYYENNMRNE